MDTQANWRAELRKVLRGHKPVSVVLDSSGSMSGAYRKHIVSGIFAATGFPASICLGAMFGDAEARTVHNHVDVADYFAHAMCSQLDDPHYRNAYRPPEHVYRDMLENGAQPGARSVLIVSDGMGIWPEEEPPVRVVLLLVEDGLMLSGLPSWVHAVRVTA